LHKTFQLVKKGIGLVFLILVTISLIMGKFSVALIFCYIIISIHNGILGYEYFRANSYKKASLHSVLSVCFLYIFFSVL
jgi:hypothetical protein